MITVGMKSVWAQLPEEVKGNLAMLGMGLLLTYAPRIVSCGTDSHSIGTFLAHHGAKNLNEYIQKLDVEVAKTQPRETA